LEKPEFDDPEKLKELFQKGMDEFKEVGVPRISALRLGFFPPVPALSSPSHHFCPLLDYIGLRYYS